jgi:molybdopterin converting factor small subunit
MPTYRLRLFAAHREAAGRSEISLDLPEGSTVADVRAALDRQFPALRRLGEATLIAVNGEFATEGRRVRPTDVLAVFPPVAGG